MPQAAPTQALRVSDTTSAQAVTGSTAYGVAEMAASTRGLRERAIAHAIAASASTKSRVARTPDPWATAKATAATPSSSAAGKPRSAARSRTRGPLATRASASSRSAIVTPAADM